MWSIDSREPDDGKLSRPVREGVWGKVPATNRQLAPFLLHQYLVYQRRQLFANARSRTLRRLSRQALSRSGCLATQLPTQVAPDVKDAALLVDPW